MIKILLLVREHCWLQWMKVSMKLYLYNSNKNLLNVFPDVRDVKLDVSLIYLLKFIKWKKDYLNHKYLNIA